MDSAATGLDGISRPSGHATALPSNTEFPPSQAERGRPPLGSLPPVSDQTSYYTAVAKWQGYLGFIS